MATIARMNIVFLDLLDWDYNVRTPSERPLAGSESALCYLAIELARQAHQVTVLSATSQPGHTLGVDCLNVHVTSPAFLAQPFDVVVILNGPADVCLKLRSLLAPTTPLVLWTQHAHDQRAMHDLSRPEVRTGWDGIVCVSQWHRDRMVEHYGLHPARVVVLRNAIAPAFENLFRSGEDLIRAKAGRLLLAYTSTPFRGLDVLLPVFAELRKVFPDAELEVFSSMQMYQEDESRDPYKPLYDQCQSAPGVRYVGSLSQPALAAALRPASVLAYPNTFAETSCIAALEALASGLLVVTSDLGALRETTMGYGVLVAPPREPDDVGAFAQRYFDRLVEVLRERSQDPAGFVACRLEQIEAVNSRYSWPTRAREWEQAIAVWRGASGNSEPIR
jgi:glycosyltransferase involved in cell wall biosynthesis